MNKQEIEKAIEFFKGCSYHCDNKEYHDMAISALQHQLTNGWIPVKSGYLPKEYGNYNVSCKNKDGKEWTTTMVYAGRLFGGQESFNKLVIAWQPLPESYKEVSE